MKNLINTINNDFPRIVFIQGTDFHWSPKQSQVSYNPNLLGQIPGQCTLLHEVGHAILNHTSYQSDLELLQMEVAAWEEAKVLGVKYKITIYDDYIQNCLDSYRDWLHLRSKCPMCGIHCAQTDIRHYKCLNCQHTWIVSSSRFCRPYRRSDSKKTSLSHNKKAMFL